MARYLAAGILLALGALLLFGWLAEAVLRGSAIAFDMSTRAAIHAWASPPLTYAMRGITQLGSPGFLIGFSVLAIVLLMRQGRRRAAALFAIAMLGAEVLDSALKVVFHRTRPAAFFGLLTPHTYSFPSGHALLSCCFYGCLAAVLAARARSAHRRATLWLAAAVIAALIGFSRIYLGVHYPSDVIAGYAAATVWVIAVRVTAEFTVKRAPR